MEEVQQIMKKEEGIKKAFEISAKQRKLANATILLLAERKSRGRIAGIVEVMTRQVEKREMSPQVLAVLVERLEGQRKRNVLSQDEVNDLEKAKRVLKEFA